MPKMGKRINGINIATLAGKIETQMGNGGRVSKSAGERNSQGCSTEPPCQLTPTPPAEPTLAPLQVLAGLKNQWRGQEVLRECCHGFGAKNYEILSICQRAHSLLQKVAR